MSSLLDTSDGQTPRKRHTEPVNHKTFTDLMEQLQEGYVASVAATAGCTFEPVRKDHWGIDAQIIRTPTDPRDDESMIYVQLKSTTRIVPEPQKEFFSYQFTKRQYFDHLVKKRTYPKALLIVMAVPPKQLEWTTSDHSGLLIRRSCYWAHLEGMEVKSSVEKPTVHIPTANLFNATSLIDILDKLDRGESLS